MLLLVSFKYFVCMKNIIKLTCSCPVKGPILARIITKTRHCSKPALMSFKCAFGAGRALCGEEFSSIHRWCVNGLYQGGLNAVTHWAPIDSKADRVHRHLYPCLSISLSSIYTSPLLPSQWPQDHPFEWSLFFVRSGVFFPLLILLWRKICNNSTAEHFGYRASIRLELFCLWQLPWRKQSLHPLQ